MTVVHVLRVAAVLLVAALGLIVIWAIQRRLIYFPFGDVPPPGDVGLPRAEAVSFATDDGLTLGGWFVPPAAPPTGVTVVVFNGNAGNRSARAPLAAMLAEAGIGTLLFDYRGYGGNPGSPSEHGLALDAAAARRYLIGRPDVDPTRLVYFGESLGSGVAVRLAAAEHPFALILRSPFTSLVDMGRHLHPLLPVRLLLRDRFASLDTIGRIQAPLLVVASRDDRVVPAAQSERLYAAANEPKRLLILDRADHNDYELLAGQRMVGAIVAFLESLPPR